MMSEVEHEARQSRAAAPTTCSCASVTPHGRSLVAKWAISQDFEIARSIEDQFCPCACAMTRALRDLMREGVAYALHLEKTMKRAATSDGWFGRAVYRFGALCASIGKRLASPAAVPVSAVILSRLNTVSPDQSLDEVAQLLVGKSLATVPVIDQGRPLGVVTRHGLAGSLQTDSPHTPIGLVTLDEVIVVTPNDSIEDVRAQLTATPGAVALVLDNGQPVGMVTEGQLDDYLAELATFRAA